MQSLDLHLTKCDQCKSLSVWIRNYRWAPSTMSLVALLTSSVNMTTVSVVQ